jgi:hypothetical protein
LDDVAGSDALLRLFGVTNASATARASLLLAVLLGACGRQDARAARGRAEGGTNASVGAPDASGGAPGSASDASDERPWTAPGDAAVSSRPIPTPPDVCASYHFEYAGAGVGGPSDCPVIDCQCQNIPAQSFYTPLGCLRSADCAFACHNYGHWFDCIVLACLRDNDCSSIPGGKCIRSPGWTQGFCESAAELGCNDASDCQSGRRCVATEADGTRTCVDPAANDAGPCNEDADCPAGHCALGAGFLGVCTVGAPFAGCFSDVDCAPGLHCRNVAGDQHGLCSDGTDNAPCDRYPDCLVGKCIRSTCSSLELGDHCQENEDCRSGFCALRSTCSDGAPDAPCSQDSECASGLCADIPGLAAFCTTGAPSSKCFDDHDCLSSSCRHEPGVDVLAAFGTCN